MTKIPERTLYKDLSNENGYIMDEGKWKQIVGWIPVSEMPLTVKTELKDFLVYRKNKTICVAYWSHCCQFENPGEIEWKMMIEDAFDDYGKPKEFEVILILKDVLFFMLLPEVKDEG